MVNVTRLTILALCIAVVASGLALGDCVCPSCKQDAQEACSSCQPAAAPVEVQKSCCGETETPPKPAPQKPHGKCTHSKITLKAAASSAPTTVWIAVDVPYIDELLPGEADVFDVDPFTPKRVKRKLFLLHSSLLL